MRPGTAQLPARSARNARFRNARSRNAPCAKTSDSRNAETRDTRGTNPSKAAASRSKGCASRWAQCQRISGARRAAPSSPGCRGDGRGEATAGRGASAGLRRPLKRACRSGRLRAVRKAPRKRATSCEKRAKCAIQKRAIQKRALRKNERFTKCGNAETRETRGTNPSKDPTKHAYETPL